MPTVEVHFLDRDLGYCELLDNPSRFPALYGSLLYAEPGLAGRVLDIGCGHGANPSYPWFERGLGELDGVDAFPAVEPASNLVRRWTCRLEDLPVDDASYDLAYSFNVVEHVREIDPFLSKAVALLKPGGCYWSLSPNYSHPFTLAARLVRKIGLLGLYQRFVFSSVNDYPAWYALSRERNVLNSIRHQNLPVARIDFYYIPDVKWRRYFPRWMQFVPRLLDTLWLLHSPRRSFNFVFRIEKTA